MKYSKIVLGHGSGGELSRKLLKELIVRILGNEKEFGLLDSAVLNIPSGRIAFTTDSYIVDPIFFPGGDIGKLAITGTVNDLLMAGSKPEFISLSLIIEEGFEITNLEKILLSIKETADDAGVKIATGDTKVLPRGKGDGIFINTAGIGRLISSEPLEPSNIEIGDVVILTGTIGDHSAAVMIEREKLAVRSSIISDCQHLTRPILKLIGSGCNIKCMRDPTRGGLAAVINEIADETSLEIVIDENKIPVRKDVAAACEILGIDPLYMANEGKAVIFTSKEYSGKVLEILKKHPETSSAKLIGEIVKPRSTVKYKAIMITIAGGERIIHLPATEQLPRIC